MKIHEYQGKELLQRFKVPVPAGGVAETPEKARQVAEALERRPFVVKAQIHAGGRGKGGALNPPRPRRRWRTPRPRSSA